MTKVFLDFDNVPTINFKVDFAVVVLEFASDLHHDFDEVSVFVEEAEIGSDGFRELFAGVLDGVDVGFKGLAESLEAVVVDGEEERFLVFEVAVEGALSDAEGVGDL